MQKATISTSKTFEQIGVACRTNPKVSRANPKVNPIGSTVNPENPKPIEPILKSVMIIPKSIGLKPNPAAAGFHLHLQMASCVLSSAKRLQLLKTTCPQQPLLGEVHTPKSRVHYIIYSH